MPVRGGNKAAMASAAAALLTAAAPAAPRFETVFASRGEPAQVHYRVRYRTATGVHRLEVWRDGDRLVKRVTDDGVATLVRHAPGGPEFTMQVADPRRRTSTRIDRTSLYRIGNFTDWFDLGHGLRHPRAAYQLGPRAPLEAMPRTPAPCRWYDLREAGRTVSICWNAADHLPLLIATAPGRPVWQVLAIDRGPIAAATFRLADRGYIHDDATRDISGD